MDTKIISEVISMINKYPVDKQTDVSEIQLNIIPKILGYWEYGFETVSFFKRNPFYILTIEDSTVPIFLCDLFRESNQYQSEREKRLENAHQRYLTETGMDKTDFCFIDTDGFTYWFKLYISGKEKLVKSITLNNLVNENTEAVEFFNSFGKTNLRETVDKLLNSHNLASILNENVINPSDSFVFFLKNISGVDFSKDDIRNVLKRSILESEKPKNNSLPQVQSVNINVGDIGKMYEKLQEPTGFAILKYGEKEYSFGPRSWKNLIVTILDFMIKNDSKGYLLAKARFFNNVTSNIYEGEKKHNCQSDYVLHNQDILHLAMGGEQIIKLASNILGCSTDKRELLIYCEDTVFKVVN